MNSIRGKEVMTEAIEAKYRFNLLSFLACGLVFFLLGGISVALWHHWREPAPVKAYRKHHDSILAYIDSIRSGRIPESKGLLGGYVILDVLVPEGLIAVKKTKDGSIHFLFESLPPDPIPSLVYCPKTSLDLRQITPSEGNAIVEGQCLEPHWFYCETDFE